MRGMHENAAILFGQPRGARNILPLIAAAIASGGIRAGVGLLENRNEVRRQRNRINDAYTFGHQRQNIQQQDVRQSEAEGLARRGLDQGGDVQVGGPVAPDLNNSFTDVSGAHTLGGQQQADLHREQGLEQNDLLRQRDNAVSDVEGQGTQNAVNQIAAGVSTGLSVASMGAPTAAPSASIASAYTAAGTDPHFAGIHPTNPDLSSDWGAGLAQSGTTNAGFTKYGGY